MFTKSLPIILFENSKKIIGMKNKKKTFKFMEDFVC